MSVPFAVPPPDVSASDPDLQELHSRLTSDDATVRRLALIELAELEDPAHVPWLLHALHDADARLGTRTVTTGCGQGTVFGDLMAGLVGAFVLVFIGVLLSQIDLVNNLQSEIAKRQQEEARRMALEKALAIPLQNGRVTLDNGRIGISGSVLFPLNSDELRPEGRQVLKSLVPPLQVYLGERDEMLMVSGFTDNKRIQEGNRRFDDNLELSAQRALTVTRALIDEGMPSSRVFAAAFGAEQPVATNSSEAGRALNRRVEMAPVPRANAGAGAGGNATQERDAATPSAGRS